MDTLLEFLQRAETVERKIEKLWLEKYKVPNSPADKISKLIEELGEAKQAVKEKDRAHEAEEIIDSIVALLGYAYVRGFSSEQLYRAFMKVQIK